MAAKANHFAENHIKKFQFVAELCQLKSDRSFFRDENIFVTINKNKTHNAIFISHSATLCDVI